MYCKNSNDYIKNDVPKTKDSTMARLSPNDENDFIVRVVTIEADGTMPNHTNKIQHQQYVLSGEAKVVVGDKVYHAKKDDFIYIPAGINHYYEACYGVSYKFLCMIPAREDEIKIIE